MLVYCMQPDHQLTRRQVEDHPCHTIYQTRLQIVLCNHVRMKNHTTPIMNVSTNKMVSDRSKPNLCSRNDPTVDRSDFDRAKTHAHTLGFRGYRPNKKIPHHAGIITRYISHVPIVLRHLLNASLAMCGCSNIRLPAGASWAQHLSSALGVT